MEIIKSLFLALVFVFPAYLISTAIAQSPKKQQAAVEKAIRQGHVVTAVLKKNGPYVREVPGVQRRNVQLGVYEYQYKGKTYKYKFWAANPPSTLTLYFVKNPAKATVDKALNEQNINWPLVFVILAVWFYL